MPDKKDLSEMKFDKRLLEKRVEDGFLTQKEVDQFLSSLSEETDFDTTTLEKEENN